MFEKFCQTAEKIFPRGVFNSTLRGFWKSLSDLTQMSRKSVLFLACPRSAIETITAEDLFRCFHYMDSCYLEHSMFCRKMSGSFVEIAANKLLDSNKHLFVA